MNTKRSIGYIICETATTLSENVRIINESVGGGGTNRVIAEGILQTADEKNRNGRIYRKEDLFPQIECNRTKELLKAGYMRGECGHPLSNELSRQQTIDGKLCCVQYLKFWTNGDDVWGQFKGTNNSLGEEFDRDLRDGCLPAFSLRALGTIENTARGAEVRNLKIITYDNVIYPSHPGAYTKGIVTESAMDIGSHGFTRHLSENMTIDQKMERRGSGLIVPISTESVINYIKSESANFDMIKESFDLLYDNIQLLENGSQVQLTTKTGDTIIVNLESYVHNEIMSYCQSRI